MTFGEDLGWGSSVEVSNAVIDRFLDRGGNFIDTANVYTRGHSETILGDHLGKFPSKRDRVVLATKFFGNLFAQDPNGGGAGRKSLMAACEESLRRLQTDYIDLYWMHCWDQHTPIEETVRALDDLVRAGKVRYIGFSDTPAWKVTQAQMTAHFKGWSPVIALQIEYSLLERTVESELLPMASELGLGVTPWSPLKSGVLSGKYTRANAGRIKADRGAWTEGNLHEKTYALVDALQPIAKEHNASVAAVAIAWVQQQSAVTSTIIGARTVEQLDANLAALDVKLTPEQSEVLEKLSTPTLSFPAPFLRNAPMFMHGGLTVNGVAGGPNIFAAPPGAKRW
jgi:aryl-alcohol dehydrogenase-like predicted oxidoreductase